MPSVFFSTLAVVERKFQLMWGMPRTSTMPMIPATRIITSTALAQTKMVITRFHARREGEKPLFIAVSSLQYHFSTTLMSMMNTNSTSAMLNSACRCKPPA